MNKDYTHIVIVVDRSGSMRSRRHDASKGINDLIEEQKKNPGFARVTIVQFDDQYETFCENRPIGEVPKYELHDRGGTALLDAVGRSINDTGIFLRGMREEDRPGLVVFVIVTDGEENASRVYSLEKVKAMIEEQQNIYKWQFMYLGANQDAFSAGTSMGISVASIAGYADANVWGAYKTSSSNLSRMRSAVSIGASVVNGFTEEERNSLSAETDSKNP